MDGADYVLSPFRGEDADVVRRSVEDASDAVELIIERGVAEAQQRYH
jgi:peptidyl-tRNA hydrolase